MHNAPLQRFTVFVSWVWSFLCLASWGHLPANFAGFAAYWDLATALLAIVALLIVRVKPLFWLFVGAFNLLGTIDLLVDYHHAASGGLRAMPGELGAAFVIPVLIVPLLMITHIAAFYLLIHSRTAIGRAHSLGAVKADFKETSVSPRKVGQSLPIRPISKLHIEYHLSISGLRIE